MNRIAFFVFFTSLLCLQCNDRATKEPKKPNVVLLLADDMGYGDFEMIGKATETPNLNRLAKEGV